MTITRDERIKTLYVVLEWLDTARQAANLQLEALGEPLSPVPVTNPPPVAVPVPNPVLPTSGNDAGVLRNEISWMSTTMLQIAQTLQQPADQTMKELPAHAEKIMTELEALKYRERFPKAT